MKKFIAAVSTVLVLFVSTVWCFGEPQNGILHIKNVDVGQNEISVYYDVTDLDGGIIENIGKDKLAASLGDKSLSVKSNEVFSKTGKSTAYVFLVDISKSITSSQWQQIQKMLGDMTNSRGKADSYALVTFGEKVKVEQDFTNDKQKFKTIIKGLKNNDTKTNLYRGIVKSLEMLSSNTSSILRGRTLVIISDGAEDDSSGITKDEAFMKIKEAHIPVFTIGMYNKASGQAGIDSIKTLGSFSRITSGKDYVIGMGSDTMPGIIKSLQDRLDKSYSAKLDCTGTALNGQSSYLKLKVDLGSGNKAEDGLNVVLTASKTTGKEKPKDEKPKDEKPDTNDNDSTSTPTETTSGGTPITPTTGDDSTSITDYLTNPYVIAAGALVVIIAAFLLIFLTGRKKKPPVPSAPANAPGKISIDASHTVSTETKNKMNPVSSPISATEAVSARKGLSVKFTKLGKNTDEAYTVNLVDSVIIGRDPGRSKLVFKEDEKLSGRHCELMIKDNMVFVCDLKSTNGTYVNGVQINNYHRLRNDDILLIGSMELRVNFNEEALPGM